MLNLILTLFSFAPIATYFMLKKTIASGLRTKSGYVFKIKSNTNFDSVFRADFSSRKSGYIPGITFKPDCDCYISSKTSHRSKNKIGNCHCEICSSYIITGDLFGYPHLIR